ALAGADHHVFAPVGCDPRTADHVAPAVADRDDLRAVGAGDHLAGPAARQVVILDVARIAAQPWPVVALHDHPVAELDYQPVAELPEHFGSGWRLHLLGGLWGLDPLALFRCERLDLDRLLELLCLLVALRRRCGRLCRSLLGGLGLGLAALALGRSRLLLAVEHRCGILGQRFAGVGRRLLLFGRRGRLIGWGLLVLCGSLLPGRSAGLACGCLLFPGRRFLCRCRRFGRGLLLFGGSLLPGRRLFSGGLLLIGRCRGFFLGRRLLLLGRGGRPIGRSLLFVSRRLGGRD